MIMRNSSYRTKQSRVHAASSGQKCSKSFGKRTRNLNLILLTVLVATLPTCQAWAQLGERREKVEAQFGKPKAADEAAGRAKYGWNGGSVVVEYENGGVRAMRWIAAGSMWPDNFKQVLDTQGGMSAWRALPPAEARQLGEAFKAWKRNDGSTAWIPETDLRSLILRYAGVIKPPPPVATPTPSPSQTASPAAEKAPPQKKSSGFPIHPLFAAGGIAVLLLGLMISRMMQKRKLAALRERRLARRNADPASLTMDECSWDEFELIVAEMMREAGSAITICPAGGAEGEAFVASHNAGKLAVSCDHKPGAGPVGEPAVRLALSFKEASGADAAALAVSRELSPAAAKLAETKGVRVIARTEIQAWLDKVIREKGKSPVDFSWWIEGFRRKVQMKGVSCPKCGAGMELKGLIWKCTKPRCSGMRPAVRLLVENG